MLHSISALRTVAQGSPLVKIGVFGRNDGCSMVRDSPSARVDPRDRRRPVDTNRRGLCPVAAPASRDLWLIGSGHSPQSGRGPGPDRRPSRSQTDSPSGSAATHRRSVVAAASLCGVGVESGGAWAHSSIVPLPSFVRVPVRQAHTRPFTSNPHKGQSHRLAEGY
jgi:hypothetical protein